MFSKISASLKNRRYFVTPLAVSWRREMSAIFFDYSRARLDLGNTVYPLKGISAVQVNNKFLIFLLVRGACFLVLGTRCACIFYVLVCLRVTEQLHWLQVFILEFSQFFS